MPEEIQNEPLSTDQLPFVAPHRKISNLSPMEWMVKGWGDFKAAPKVSLTYGGMLVLISYVLSIASWHLGGYVLLFSLLSGLVFIAPVLALGLYSVSCQIHSGQKPRLAYCFREGRRHIGNELVFSVVLLIVFLLWARAGSGMHIFFPVKANADMSQFFLFYGIGSVVGAVFAAIVFCASAFSLPMMMDRQADAITAVLTSVSAVMGNKLAMLNWAAIIVICVITCFVTAFLAMAVLMPVLGYATWHGYRETIDASQWPENRKLGENFRDYRDEAGE